MSAPNGAFDDAVRDSAPQAQQARVSRRRFLAGLGAAGAVAASGAAFWVWTRDGAATAPNELRTGNPAPTTAPLGTGSGNAGTRGRTLVVLEFAGGNDALNMVVPHGDPRYFDLRPTLAIKDPIDLDGHIGLAPQLTTLAAEFNAGRLAIVEGVGVPNPDLSHFASLATWWTADPKGTTGTGWLGRYLDATVGFTNPLAGIAIGPGPSPVLGGAASFVTSIADANGLVPAFPIDADASGALIAQWSGFATAHTDGADLVAGVRSAIADTVEARDRLSAMLAKDAHVGSGTDAKASPKGNARQSARRARRSALDLPGALALAARFAASEDAPRVVHVHVDGDFDTHQGQAQRHAALMRQLDEGVSAYLATLTQLGATDRAVLMTTSEFGRRARENGTGTDHGTAAAHFVLGTAARGGRHGQAPSLARLDSAGNLVHTVDFRSYYATLLDGWLDVDATEVLGADYEVLPVFA